MSALAERAGATAVARLLDRMAALVAEELPDVAAERVDGGLRLAGQHMLVRRVEDARLRGLAILAARMRP